MYAIQIYFLLIRRPNFQVKQIKYVYQHLILFHEKFSVIVIPIAELLKILIDQKNKFSKAEITFFSANEVLNHFLRLN